MLIYRKKGKKKGKKKINSIGGFPWLFLAKK